MAGSYPVTMALCMLVLRVGFLTQMRTPFNFGLDKARSASGRTRP